MNSENCSDNNCGGCGEAMPEKSPLATDKPKPLLLIHAANFAGFRDFAVGMGQPDEGEPQMGEMEAGGFQVKCCPTLFQDNFLTLEQMKKATMDRCQDLADTFGCHVLGNNVLCMLKGTSKKSPLLNPSSCIMRVFEKPEEGMAEHFRQTRKMLIGEAAKLPSQSFSAQLISFSVMCRPFQEPVLPMVQQVEGLYQMDRDEADTEKDFLYDCLHHFTVRNDDRYRKLKLVGDKEKELILRVNPRAKGMCQLLEDFLEQEQQKKDAMEGEG